MNSKSPETVNGGGVESSENDSPVSAQENLPEYTPHGFIAQIVGSIFDSTRRQIATEYENIVANPELLNSAHSRGFGYDKTSRFAFGVAVGAYVVSQAFQEYVAKNREIYEQAKKEFTTPGKRT